MPAVTLTLEDLAPFASIPEAKALAMIEDVLALAARVAPCILLEDFEHAGAARAILRSAVLRWHDAGSGAATQQTAGPFSVSTSVARTSMFWPTEITNLQGLCSGAGDESGGAYAIDTLPYRYPHHADICSLAFGALYCSCGADLTGSYPLWEVDNV